MANFHFYQPAPVSRIFQNIFLGLALLMFCSNTLNAQTIYALSGNNLIAFQASAPGTMLSSKPISGIGAGLSLSGLDFRPNTGELYGIAYNQMTGAARLYTINLNTGVATALGAGPVVLKPGMGKIGFDFNPTVDRIRVTGSDNSNFRLHPITGAIAATDGSLAFTAADVNTGTDPSVGAVAYTNSYIGTTSTTLYNYDDSLNILTSQIPPNDGTLNTVGASGIAVNPADQSTDLDIFFDAVSGTNRAYLAANTGTDVADNLYTVNLMTGAVSLLGPIGVPVSDIAVFIDRTIPATISGQIVWALTSSNNLISFDSGLPGTIRSLVATSGIMAGQTLVGSDFRPATGELYAMGYSDMTGMGQLYTINTSTGAATAVGAAFTLNPGMGKISFDFNPTVDRIRVMGSDNSNFRLHPVTGAIAATDGNQAFTAGDVNAGTNPSVGAAAYTNSFNGTTTTTLYDYDDSLNVLISQIPPNNGTLNTIGASGLMVNLADQSTDMDIFYNPFSGMNVAYLSANTGTSASDNLYTINLSTGATTLIGRIGNGIAIKDIAVVIQPIETACDTKTIGCMKYEVLAVKQGASGGKTYRIRVTNNCADAHIYTAFQLPKGVVADAPGNSYASPGGHNYEVRNPNFSPFYSIRFKEQGNSGIANGQMDVFEYTLPAYSNPNYIHVISRLGTSTYQEAYLNVFSCDITNQLMDDAAAANRTDGASALSANEVRLFPNPTNGDVFADLSTWEAPQIQIRVFSAMGQQVLNYTAANNGIVKIALPEGLTEGLYLLECSTADGMKSVQKVMLRR